MTLKTWSFDLPLRFDAGPENSLLKMAGWAIGLFPRFPPHQMGLETSRGLLEVEPGLERPKGMFFVNGSEEEALDVKDRSLKQADTLLCCQVVSLRRGHLFREKYIGYFYVCFYLLR